MVPLADHKIIQVKNGTEELNIADGQNRLLFEMMI